MSIKWTSAEGLKILREIEDLKSWDNMSWEKITKNVNNTFRTNYSKYALQKGFSKYKEIIKEEEQSLNLEVLEKIDMRNLKAQRGFKKSDLNLDFSSLQRVVERRQNREATETKIKIEDEEAKLIADEKEKLLSKIKKNITNKDIREKARTEILGDIVREAVKALPEIKVNPPKFHPGPAKEEELVLLFSDSQIGQETLAEETGGLSEYGIDSFRKRMQILINGIMNVTQRLRYGGPIKKLKVFFLGDIVDGEDIFPGHKNYIDQDVVDQMFTAADEITKMLIQFANVFEEIECHCVGGNHGRTGKKDEAKYHTSWDYVLYKFLEARLQNQKSIKWFIPKTWWYIVPVQGWNFLLVHGEDVKGNGGNPLSGGERTHNNYSRLFEMNNLPRVQYTVFGHHHVGSDKDSYGGEIIANGAWPGGSHFSLKKLSVASRPNQLLFSVNEDLGITFRYKIWLDKE